MEYQQDQVKEFQYYDLAQKKVVPIKLLRKCINQKLTFGQKLFFSFSLYSSQVCYVNEAVCCQDKTQIHILLTTGPIP